MTKRSVIRWEMGGEIRLDMREKYARGLSWSLATFAEALAADDGLPTGVNGHSVPSHLTHFASCEQGASVVHTYNPVTLPGLLQTAAYATEVESVWPVGADPQDVAQRVEHRIMRQHALETVKLHALIDMSSILRTTGDEDVMSAQLDHLRAMNERPNVHVRVVPLDQRAHAAGSGSFTLFTGQEQDTPYMVATHNVMGPDYSEIPMMVMAYVSLFAHLWESSDDLAQEHLLVQRGGLLGAG